jgi:hypothetical protein
MTTTIAVPDVHAIQRYAKGYIDRYGVAEYETEGGTLTRRSLGMDFHSHVTPYIQADIFRQIDERIYRSGAFTMDDRRVYGAYGQGIASVPLRFLGDIQHLRATEIQELYDTFVMKSPQSVAAFTAYCDRAENVYTWTGSELIRGTVAHFIVEKNIYLHHARRPTRTVTAYFPYANPDGSIPVEAGKQYAVMGTNYSQGDLPPGWYDAIPVNKNLPNGLYMDILNKGYSLVKVDTVTDFRYFESDVIRGLFRLGIGEKDMPIDILARTPEWDVELGSEGLTWFELTGSLEEALAFDTGANLHAALSVAEISHNSLQVFTTNDLNSFLRFNQYVVRMATGRAFNAKEVTDGLNVCVISQQLAEINGLHLGDTLTLRLYPTGLTPITVNKVTAWAQNPYHPSMPLTEPITFTIVGTYAGPSQEMNDHGISLNTVFIPAASFDGSGTGMNMGVRSPYNPPLLDTIIVPNGEITETMALMEETAEGFGMFFRFFDQGYAALKPVLTNLRIGLVWVMSLSAAGWVIAMVMFSLFYIGRKRQEAVLLHDLGVNERQRAFWVFIQCAAVIILAQGIILSATLPLYGTILDAAVSAAEAFTDTYRDYRLSDMNEAGGMQLRLPLDKTALGLIAATVGETFILFIIAGVLSIKAAKPFSLNKKRVLG